MSEYVWAISTLIDKVTLCTAQWEFGRPTLTPTYLEYKTEAKVN